MRGLVLIAPGLHVAPRRRLDEDVDVFGEPVDGLVPLRQRGAALELEGEAKLLQAVEAVHDRGGAGAVDDAVLVGVAPDAEMVQSPESMWAPAPGRERSGKISSMQREPDRQTRVKSALNVWTASRANQR